MITRGVKRLAVCLSTLRPAATTSIPSRTSRASPPHPNFRRRKAGGSSQLSTASTSRSAANGRGHSNGAAGPRSSSSPSPSFLAVDPELERTFRGRGALVTGVSYSPDMKQLVSSAADNNLLVWTFRAQLRVRTR